ncbi:MAG: hypothetical protein PHU58_07410 [Prevotella sp.]|nr:hypothetical protein [Prevotella sp.]
MRKLKNGQGYITTEAKSFKQIEREAFETMAKKMDERDEVFRLMKVVEDASETIPAKYAQDARVMMNYEAYKILGSWRDQQNVVLRLRKAARKVAKKQTKKR